MINNLVTLQMVIR